MKLSDYFLWPGTKVCGHYGIDPKGEAALIRWLVNAMVYLVVSLLVVWAIVS